MGGLGLGEFCPGGYCPGGVGDLVGGGGGGGYCPRSDQTPFSQDGLTSVRPNFSKPW